MVGVFVWCCMAVVVGWRCVGVVFAWCCVAVVLVASHGRRLCAVLCRCHLHVALRGGRLCMVLCRRCLRVALCGGCPCGIAWQVSLRSVAQASSSCGCCLCIVWRCLRVAQGLSSRGRCVCIVVVIVAAWSLRGKGTYLPMPPQTVGAVQGWGVKGATAMPLHRHEPCLRTNGGQGAKGGFPGQKGGCQRAIGGGGRGGHVPSHAPANGRGCAEEGHKRGSGPAPA
jgi:hypothetical protein